MFGHLAMNQCTHTYTTTRTSWFYSKKEGWGRLHNPVAPACAFAKLFESYFYRKPGELCAASWRPRYWILVIKVRKRDPETPALQSKYPGSNFPDDFNPSARCQAESMPGTGAHGSQPVQRPRPRTAQSQHFSSHTALQTRCIPDLQHCLLWFWIFLEQLLPELSKWMKFRENRPSVKNTQFIFIYDSK